MTNDLPSVGTEDARRVSEADLADLMALHKFTSEGVWAQGQTSHHTVAKREGRDDYRIAEFHHAADASFVDVAHKYMPLLIGEVTDLRRERDELASRVRTLEAEVLQQARINGMGAERELALASRVMELERERDRLTLSRIDRECLRIGQEIQRAAGELPDGYEMEIEIERGAGSVYLSKPDYSKVSFHDMVDGMSYAITEAIDAAIASKEQP